MVHGFVGFIQSPREFLNIRFSFRDLPLAAAEGLSSDEDFFVVFFLDFFFLYMSSVEELSESIEESKLEGESDEESDDEDEDEHFFFFFLFFFLMMPLALSLPTRPCFVNRLTISVSVFFCSFFFLH